MAVPTIDSLTPTSGPTMADALVAITGTGFRPATLPSTGVFTNGALPQSVRVFFGDVLGLDARCFTSTLVTVRAPKHDVGVVDVRLENLDQDTGEPIAGEAVTAPNAYTYALPIHTSDHEGDLARLVRTILRLFKRELLAKDVTHAVATDYVDPTTDGQLHITKFAELPGISLVGPELDENRFFSLNEEPTIEDPSLVDDDGNPTDFVRTRVPYTVDVHFTIVGASDNKVELLNLMQNFVAMMHRNKKIAVDRDPSDPTKGTVSYEMDFEAGGQPKARKIAVGVESSSNLRVFDASFLVRGFDIEGPCGVDVGSTAGVPNQNIVERGKTVATVTVDPAVQTAVSSSRPGDPSP